jgi:ATP phosphoribosyltransferase
VAARDGGNSPELIDALMRLSAARLLIDNDSITAVVKEVEQVIHSEAVLVANPHLTAEKQAILDSLLFRIDAVTNSRGKKYILLNLPACKVNEAIAILPAMRSPSVMPLADSDWCSLHSVVKANELGDKIERLKQIGAEGILVLDLDKVIE